MAKSWTRKALLSMEAGVGAVADAGDISESTPDEQVEVESVATEASGDLDDVSTTAEADIATLEDHEEQLAESEDNGGVSPEVAQTISASVENIRRRYGALMSDVKKPVRTLEAFTKKDKRQAATSYAREAVMDTLNKVWEAIKQFFIDLAAKIKGWFNNVFDSNTKLKNTINDLKKKLSGVKGDAAESTFENEAWAKALSWGGKCDEKTIEQGVKNVMSALDTTAKVVDQGVKDVEFFDKEMRKETTAGDRAYAEMGTAVDTFTKVFDGLGGKVAVTEKDGFDVVEDGSKQAKYGEMIGGKCIVAMAGDDKIFTELASKEDEATMIQIFGRCKVSIQDFDPKGTFEEKEVPVGEISFMQNVLSEMGKLTSNIDKLKSKSSALEKTLENAAKGVDYMIKQKAPKDTSTKDKKKAKEVMLRAMKAMATMLSGLTFGLVSLASSTGWTVCKWIDRSIGFYKESK